VEESTRDEIERWWREVFDVGRELWSSVTVSHPHASLGDYEGWFVAWREGGVHVSAPSSAEAHEVASLANEAAIALRDAAFWQAFAHQRGLEVIGPSTHFYLDADPGPAVDVVALRADELALLRDQVLPHEWVEAGMAHEPPPAVAFGIVVDGTPLAAASLDEWRDAPSDIGVVVARDHRGHGLAEVVGRHAASYAVRHSGIARWRAATTNIASARTAERLGFEPYATQLAVRRGRSPA
jgi:GNAT superfamily N-acetyltransferase